MLIFILTVNQLAKVVMKVILVSVISKALCLTLRFYLI